MIIYSLVAEAVPHDNNPESKEYGGAYISCCIKADNPTDALRKAKEYIHKQNWVFINIEDIFAVQREQYIDEPDSLECYDNALQYGLDAIFHTWPID